MSLDTIVLQCFLSVAETGNVTKAALRVGRTQSAVSQQIAKLEATLDKQLFIRGKQFTLTQDGELFLMYARQILALHREAIDRFKQPELQGEFRFGMPEDFASVYLSDVLVEFAHIHPRVLVNVECDLTLNLYERFKKNEFDMVLLKMSRPGDFANGVEVYSEKLVWVRHPSLPIKVTDVVPMVLSPQPCVYRASALKALESAKIAWRVVFSSPSYAGTLAAVKAGLGVTVLPRTMVPDQLEIFKAPQFPKLEDTHVCLLKQRNDDPALLSFEKFVLDQLKY